MIEAQDFTSRLKKTQPRHWNPELDVELFNAIPTLVFFKKILTEFWKRNIMSKSVVIYFLKAVDYLWVQ